MTATNLPAALAGARVSPLDGVNLNRAYPGDPDGGPTKAIAHYVDSVIFPMTDYHLDLHSGGSSLDYHPFVSMRRSQDPEPYRPPMAAPTAFAGPRAPGPALSPARAISAAASAATASPIWRRRCDSAPLQSRDVRTRRRSRSDRRSDRRRARSPSRYRRGPGGASSNRLRRA